MALKNALYLFLFLSMHATYAIEELFEEDLEAQPQSFVIETKQIHLSEYPDAFNPSIIRWNGRLLMSFRHIENQKDSYNSSMIGLVWLNEEFEPISTPQLLNLHEKDYKGAHRAEDARLIAVGQELLIVYSDNEDILITKGGFRVIVAKLVETDGLFNILEKRILLSFEGANSELREKNWTPFDYQDSLYLSYSLEPHLVFKLPAGSSECETIGRSTKMNSWSWGQLRGGTQTLKLDNQFLTFFHSCKRMTSRYSQGREMLHYFMGACTFSCLPPFEMEQISPEPIVGTGFFSGPIYKPYWGSWRGVFPCGFIFDDHYIWVLYGQQNHELWVVKLDRQGLLQSLVSVE